MGAVISRNRRVGADRYGGGVGADDPLAGRRPAIPTQLNGRGLLVVNHLADLVRTHTRPGQTTIRAYFRP